MLVYPIEMATDKRAGKMAKSRETSGEVRHEQLNVVGGSERDELKSLRERVEKLEKWQHFVLGVAAATGTIVGFAVSMGLLR